MKYDTLKEAYEMGKKRALNSSYYRFMVWPIVQKKLRVALIEAWMKENKSNS